MHGVKLNPEEDVNARATCLRLTWGELARLDSAAKRSGSTRSEIMRTAISRYLDELLESAPQEEEIAS
jgi:predicted DNA-binding protein